ncbi:flavodoxin family protein [Malonomonas rubra]|uniref:flavodoxin family protein n=1 Tax=Malonomonas rubra TaxID=57040 RepID=UPI0026F1DADE|nr:flavodoxin family protein [Malonomonas rubra]
MKLLHIYGSPRQQGNTADISAVFCKVAERHGASVECYDLNRLSYRGCQACFACKKSSERCVLQDDITPALDAIQEADVILFSSPVYYTDVTAQLKGFIDRTFSYFVPDYWKHEKKSRLRPGKQLVFLLVQGATDEERFNDIFPRYREIFSWHPFKQIHLLRATGVYRPGQAAKRPDIMLKAEQLAERIFTRGT